MRKIDHFFLIWFVVMLLLNGCAEELVTANGVQRINIPNNKARKGLRADDLFKIEIIPLEVRSVNDWSNQARKIHIMEGKIFIVDAQQANHISIFSTEGRFLQKLKFNSKEFEDFSTITSIRFFPEEQQIELYDLSSNREIVISTEGRLIKSRSNVFPYRQKASLGDQFTVFDGMGLADLRWNIKDSDYNTYGIMVMEDSVSLFSNLRPYPPIANKYPSYEPADLFYVLNERVHYYRPFCDTIFKVFSKKLQHKYFINYSYNRHPNALLMDPFISDKQAYCVQNKHPFTRQVYETRSHLIIFYYYKENAHCFIYDKIKQEAILNAKSLYFDSSGLMLPVPLSTAGTERDFVRLLAASEVKKIFKRADRKGKLPQSYKKLYDEIKDRDSPCLIRYTLKE